MSEYATLGLGGLGVAIALAVVLARLRGINAVVVLEVAIVAAFFGVLGGRLAGLPTGGMSSIGLLLALPAALWMAHRRGLPLLDLLDIAAICAPVGLVFVRLGCASAGCCHTAGRVAPRLMAVVLFGLAIALIPVWRRSRVAGLTFLLFAVAYPTLRFALPFAIA